MNTTEQENLNLLLLDEPELQNKFISAYSSSNKARHALLTTMLTTDLSKIKSIDIGEDAIPNSTQTTRAIFKSIGVDVHNETKQDIHNELLRYEAMYDETKDELLVETIQQLKDKLLDM